MSGRVVFAGGFQLVAGLGVVTSVRTRELNKDYIKDMNYPNCSLEKDTRRKRAIT